MLCDEDNTVLPLNPAVELVTPPRDAVVPPDSPSAVPGTWAWPADPDSLRVPYTVREGDSLDGIAAHFPGADLIVVDAEMPAAIASGVTVTAGGETVTTTAYASFAAVCALFRPPIDLAALAASIGERTDVPATGALLVCPPGVLPGQPAADGVTPRAAARPFGVTAVALLAATATRDRTAVPAARCADPAQDGALTRAAFAEQVQRAVPVPVLRLATAPGRTSDTDVWAVVFDADGIERVRIEPPCEIAGARQPRAFALRPLSTTLMARRRVTTFGFDVRTGELTAGRVSDYQGIDLEAWARAFPADAELLLSAAYGRAVHRHHRRHRHRHLGSARRQSA
ncbi:hypothetical protein OG311_36500 [Streptomyces sp. NBC_01343]|uniref:hypothetical protein n=1 Tax=Streptomyces sp. NBC_01343 TaxID=2903832 RepID=UPI002E141EA8|nr:hypothetical protein OG311_36500 [Streptomyces sp. NBC_01343]